MAKDKNNTGIVSINGNVKNGLIYYSAPSSTGGLPDKSVMRCGGRKKAPWGTLEDGSQVWIIDNALDNARPQYYAERRLPLFEDGAAIQSGLVRAGWSHGNSYQPNISIDIPAITVNSNRSYRTSPRKGSNNGTKSVPIQTNDNLPAVPRFRNSLSVEANLDPGTIPTSVIDAAHAIPIGRQYGEYAGVTPRDWMSLAGNIAGSIGSWIANRNAPRVTIAEPNRPFIEMPVRLRTHYNNRPQIANVENQAIRSYRQIGENTGSSAAALARMQRVRNAAVQNINELNAEKENIETQLTNQDRLNRQQVRSRNAKAMNQYYQDLASAKTRQSIADAQRKSANQSALSNLLNNINVSFQDFLGRMDRRESFNNTLAYLRAANPNYDDRMFKDNGANFARMYLQGRNIKD